MANRHYAPATQVGNVTDQGPFASLAAANATLTSPVPAGNTYEVTINGARYIARAGETEYTLVADKLVMTEFAEDGTDLGTVATVRVVREPSGSFLEITLSTGEILST